MIEIIPNYHPIFVHFTLALFVVTLGFHLLSYMGARMKRISPHLTQEFETVGRWCLWICALMTFLTIPAGLYAYYTVGHDEVSHAVMTDHRNWAIPTAIAIWLVSLWSLYRYIKHQPISCGFIIALLIVQSLVLSTAWRGSELVYRYGLGVMSLPKAEEVGHQHAHMPEHKMLHENGAEMHMDNQGHNHDTEE